MKNIRTASLQNLYIKTIKTIEQKLGDGNVETISTCTRPPEQHVTQAPGVASWIPAKREHDIAA